MSREGPTVSRLACLCYRWRVCFPPFMLSIYRCGLRPSRGYSIFLSGLASCRLRVAGLADVVLGEGMEPFPLPTLYTYRTGFMGSRKNRIGARRFFRARPGRRSSRAQVRRAIRARVTSRAQVARKLPQAPRSPRPRSRSGPVRSARPLRPTRRTHARRCSARCAPARPMLRPPTPRERDRLTPTRPNPRRPTPHAAPRRAATTAEERHPHTPNPITRGPQSGSPSSCQ